MENLDSHMHLTTADEWFEQLQEWQMVDKVNGSLGHDRLVRPREWQLAGFSSFSVQELSWTVERKKELWLSISDMILEKEMSYPEEPKNKNWNATWQPNMRWNEGPVSVLGTTLGVDG